MSAMTTRSQASTSLAPPPAAVPLTAAMTGFSQSRIDPTSRCQPRADHAGDVAERAVGRVVGPLGTRLLRSAEAGAGAEVALARAGQHDGAHAERRRTPRRTGRPAVAHVRRQRVARFGAVDGDAGDAVGRPPTGSGPRWASRQPCRYRSDLTLVSGISQRGSDGDVRRQGGDRHRAPGAASVARRRCCSPPKAPRSS